MVKKVIGTTEDRLNRFMQMCLEWQRDLRSFVYHPAAYYFTNYHIGKVKQTLLGDLKNTVIDRDWAIDKMNEISLTRAENEVKLGYNAQNRTIYNQTNRKTASQRQLNLFEDVKPTEAKAVTKRKSTKKVETVSKFAGISDVELLNEVLSRYKTMLESNK